MVGKTASSNNTNAKAEGGNAVQLFFLPVLSMICKTAASSSTNPEDEGGNALQFVYLAPLNTHLGSFWVPLGTIWAPLEVPLDPFRRSREGPDPFGSPSPPPRVRSGAAEVNLVGALELQKYGFS